MNVSITSDENDQPQPQNVPDAPSEGTPQTNPSENPEPEWYDPQWEWVISLMHFV